MKLFFTSDKVLVSDSNMKKWIFWFCLTILHSDSIVYKVSTVTLVVDCFNTSRCESRLRIVSLCYEDQTSERVKGHVSNPPFPGRVCDSEKCGAQHHLPLSGALTCTDPAARKEDEGI